MLDRLNFLLGGSEKCEIVGSVDDHEGAYSGRLSCIDQLPTTMFLPKEKSEKFKAGGDLLPGLKVYLSLYENKGENIPNDWVLKYADRTTRKYLFLDALVRNRETEHLYCLALSHEEGVWVPSWVFYDKEQYSSSVGLFCFVVIKKNAAA